MFTLRRVTTNSHFIPQIDGLRFIAIASVILFHLHDSLSHNGVVEVPAFDVDRLSVLARRGVELFFTISGFILGIPFASYYLRNSHKVNLKRYFLRRLTRLEPPYIINLLIWTSILVLVVHHGFRELLPHLLASIAYLHTLLYKTNSTINGVTWSLEVEVQFYTLVPILACLFSIARPTIRRCAILLLMFVSAISTMGSQNPLVQRSILFYLAFFLAGFLLCALYLLRTKWQPTLWWDVVALLGWPLVWYLGERTGHVLLPFIVVLLYLAAFRGIISSTLLSNRFLTDVGGMCYTLYLFHFLIISSVARISKPWHLGHNFWAYFFLQAFIVFPFVVLFCGFYYLLVERPCMNPDWPHRLADWFAHFGSISKSILWRFVGSAK